MKAEYTAEDFKKGVRNPYFAELCKKCVVTVTNEDYAVYEMIAERNGEPPEWLMRRCLADYARTLAEDED